MRRICCFCEKWESGGIEAFLCNVLLHMDRTDMEVDIVTVRQRESLFTQRLAAAGISVTELSGTLRSPKNAALFRRLLQERKYDVIHFNLFQGLSLRYVQIAKNMGVPVRIVHSHGAGLRASKTKPIKLLLHRLGRTLWTRSATTLWACSKPAAQFLFGREAKYARMIPNGIAVDAFRFSQESRAHIRKELDWSENLIIGTVGRLSQEKNQAFLLDVFAHFFSTHPHSRLLLVGDGDLLEPLKQRAAQLGIAPHTTFWGASQNVEEFLCAMDVFLFPSFMEGLGISVIEAQASGLPVLCSDRIPKEARLTDLVKALPLDAGAAAWSQALQHQAALVIDRTAFADAVKAAGFDVADTVKRIEMKYMGSHNEQS